LFSIDSTTGILNLIGKLDRDRPNGREIYQFNIEAVDEPGSVSSTNKTDRHNITEI
jgi:hypothetical protein